MVYLGRDYRHGAKTFSEKFENQKSHSGGQKVNSSFIGVRDGSKFIGYPGRDHRQGGEDFFSKKNRGAQTFFRKNLKI